MKCLIRLFSGTEYHPQSSGRKRRLWEEPRDVNWAGSQSEEEELKSLLDTIRQRVSTLKETVQEQSKEIERHVDDIEQIVKDKDDE